MLGPSGRKAEGLDTKTDSSHMTLSSAFLSGKAMGYGEEGQGCNWCKRVNCSIAHVCQGPATPSDAYSVLGLVLGLELEQRISTAPHPAEAHCPGEAGEHWMVRAIHKEGQKMLGHIQKIQKRQV